MADDMATSEVATRLGTTTVTVRKLIEQGRLQAEKQPLGGERFRWTVDARSVEKLARSGWQARSHTVADRVAALEQEVAALQRAPSPSKPKLAAERDDLRARVVTLEEALARTRTAAEFQRAAGDLRAHVVSQLLAALEANESVEELHRRAIAELEEAAASATRAGHLGQG